MADFRRKKVCELQQFLSKRGIQYSNKRKEELIELCVNAQDLNVAQLETDEACEVAIENKLRTPEGDLPKPANLTQWTNNFYKAPEFTFADLFVYLVEKKGYDKESLRAFKSLQGYRLYADGHVEELSYHSVEGGKYCFFKFGVKPTEKSKTQDGQKVYRGWLVMKADGSIFFRILFMSRRVSYILHIYGDCYEFYVG